MKNGDLQLFFLSHGRFNVLMQHKNNIMLRNEKL